MSFDLLTAEQEAAQSVIDLLALAKKSQVLHERANMALPEPLKRVLGLATNGHRKAVATVPPPERPPLPIGAESDWVAIPAKSAFPTSLALALLRASSPMPVRDLIDRITDILDDVNKGTIHNLGTRLESNDVISRSKEGWELLKTEAAPILDEGLIWAPASILTKQELAVHRREALMHVLRAYQTGLQTSQLIEALQNCAWVHAPVSKELIQDDIELLSAPPAKIRRRGNSKKWEAIKEKDI